LIGAFLEGGGFCVGATRVRKNGIRKLMNANIRNLDFGCKRYQQINHWSKNRNGVISRNLVVENLKKDYGL
jgi:hypothetical protein